MVHKISTDLQKGLISIDGETDDFPFSHIATAQMFFYLTDLVFLLCRE